MGLMFGKFSKSKVVGEIKFGEWIDSAIRMLIISKIWMVLVLQITCDLPNSPNFLYTRVMSYGQHLEIPSSGFLAVCWVVHGRNPG